MREHVRWTILCAALGLVGGSLEAEAAKRWAGAAYEVVDATLVQAGARPDDWLTHGRTYDEQRYSPLDEINVGNVAKLGLVWDFETQTDRGLEASPLVVDGVMYTTGSWSLVFAFEAATGRLRWKYDPEVPRRYGQRACCDVVNRGVALFQGKVFVGTIDGRLVALDAESGKVVWEKLTVDPAQPYTITGAPRVVKGRVIIGNGGAEYGVRGYVSAYDAESGELAWRFYTVPGNPADGFESPAMEEAAKTWTGEWWKMGGGGTAWDSMAYDPELDLLYVGTGNGSPWNRNVRSPGGGDNLYLSSIVALRPDSGELVWHYQTTPGDSWDYTATQHMILADLEIGGRKRQVLMQAPKNGFFYVLDRRTGELLSAEAYVSVNWAEGIDLETGRPVEKPEARYHDGGALVLPSPFGGHNWQPMAFSPKTGLVYIPAQEIPNLYAPDPDFTFTAGQWNLGVAPPAVEDLAPELVAGHLLAWDPVAQEERWRAQHELPWHGGVLTTAGNLVFQGTPYGFLVAYNATTGERLWQAYCGSGVIAPPVTYRVGDRQYLTVMAGWGGAFALVGASAAASAEVTSAGRVLTFALGGSDELPERETITPPRIAKLPNPATPEQIADGRRLYGTYCAVCHGFGAVGGGVIPDVRYAARRTYNGLAQILLEGTLEDRGMPSFRDVLGASEVAAIKGYLLSRRSQLLEARKESGAP